ncbi:hypothetical protein PBY51_004884 [Eleginops maclovinus]|uniref:Uncharacterized protein n=1 Tax=Eleginops maclovinus TaxID=56733 RepID=A0AAN8AH09_ELEMC|nr:hypothetical protein PBY51_004884 [Eleginops maclovinus]
MGEVEVSVLEKGAPELQHDDLRLSLQQMRPQGLQRHLVVQCPNCGCLFSVEEAKFKRGLKFFFILLLTWAVVNLIILIVILTTTRYEHFQVYISTNTWIFKHFYFELKGNLLLGMFAALVAVGLLEKKKRKSTGSAPPRKEQVQTLSALVQQV